MAQATTVQDVVQLASGLSPLEKLKVIERLAPELEMALAGAGDLRAMEEAYQAGYRRVPEDVTEIEAMLPHLPLPEEKWE